jgi:hypothetical protein
MHDLDISKANDEKWTDLALIDFANDASLSK